MRLLLALCILFIGPSFLFGAGETDDALFVERVIDGDTLVLSNGRTVRLIGVDTPETVHPDKSVEHFGEEATAFTTKEILGKKVELIYEERKKDKYGRDLAYVVNVSNGELLNALIIREGFGHAYLQYPFKYQEEFRLFEQEARRQHLGLWAEEDSVKVNGDTITIVGSQAKYAVVPRVQQNLTTDSEKLKAAVEPRFSQKTLQAFDLIQFRNFISKNCRTAIRIAVGKVTPESLYGDFDFKKWKMNQPAEYNNCYLLGEVFGDNSIEEMQNRKAQAILSPEEYEKWVTDNEMQALAEENARLKNAVRSQNQSGFGF